MGVVLNANNRITSFAKCCLKCSHVMKKDAEVLEKLLGTIRTSFSALHLQIFNQIGR